MINKCSMLEIPFLERLVYKKNYVEVKVPLKSHIQTCPTAIMKNDMGVYSLTILKNILSPACIPQDFFFPRNLRISDCLHHIDPDNVYHFSHLAKINLVNFQNIENVNIIQ